MNECLLKLAPVPIPPSWKIYLETNGIAGTWQGLKSTPRSQKKPLKSCRMPLNGIHSAIELSTSWALCSQRSFTTQKNPLQNYTGCTLKFLLQRQGEDSTSARQERKVSHHWFRQRKSNFDAWKWLFSFSHQLLVCLLCVSESHDIVLHTK